MRWTIHLTGRDSLGNVSKQFLGDHVLSELLEALRIACSGRRRPEPAFRWFERS
jgi:hypothetical protein